MYAKGKGKESNIHVNSEADIKITNWLAKVTPLLELWEMIPEVGKKDLEEKMRKKVAQWAVFEALEGNFLIDKIPELCGHKDAEPLLREAINKICEIAKVVKSDHRF